MSKQSLWIDDRSVAVLATGKALPGEPISNDALLNRLAVHLGLDVKRRGQTVARLLGIETRHIARAFNAPVEPTTSGQSNADLSARAVKSALTAADLTLDRVAYLIGHTATPDHPLPSNIAAVAERLSYQGPFAEFRQACTGFVNALIFAVGILAQVKDHVVVIVGSETGSVFFDPRRACGDDGQLVNLMQMGDGAAAIVLANANHAHARLGTLGHLFHGQVGSQRKPGLTMRDSGACQPWTDGAVAAFEHDFDGIKIHGLDLFAAALGGARAAGVDLSDLSHVLPHQANGRLDRLLVPLLAPHTPKIATQARVLGNTGSAAMWLALDEVCQIMPAGDRALLLGAEATKYMFGGAVFERG